MDALRSSFSWLINAYAYTSTTPPSIAFEEGPKRYCPGGYHPAHIGENFNNRYQIVSKLGYVPHHNNRSSCRTPRYIALKILTADSYGSLKPVYELDILKHMSENKSSHPGYKHIVHMLDSFVHEGPNGKHLCLILELMGQSVFNLQRYLPNKQLPVHIGRKVAEQILNALDWLHGSCGIIHTDIKPDNILIEIPDVDEAVEKHVTKLKENKSGQTEDSRIMSRPIFNDTVLDSSKFNIRITDFGVASWKDNHLNEWIQPASLRAPEVFLGAPWDSSVDIWGLACVIYELLQGRVLFRGRPGPKDAWTAEEDQIAQMIELFGPIPSSVRERGKLSSKYFDENGSLLHIKQLYPYSLRDLLAQTTNNSMSVDDYKQFEVFLQAILKYEPTDRKKPKELLKDPWLLQEVLSPSASKASTC